MKNSWSFNLDTMTPYHVEVTFASYRIPKSNVSPANGKCGRFGLAKSGYRCVTQT